MTLKTSCPKPPKSIKPPRKRIKRKPRSPSEFARIYGSKARVEWVKMQACRACGARPSVNAHIGHEGAGAGRKANYDQIAPLCHTCHTQLHDYNALLAQVVRMQKWEIQTEIAWQSYLTGVAK